LVALTRYIKGKEPLPSLQPSKASATHPNEGHAPRNAPRRGLTLAAFSLRNLPFVNDWGRTMTDREN
jgi:hypothetical protein